jgi:hypothetical protein
MIVYQKSYNLTFKIQAQVIYSKQIAARIPQMLDREIKILNKILIQ